MVSPQTLTTTPGSDLHSSIHSTSFLHEPEDDSPDRTVHGSDGSQDLSGQESEVEHGSEVTLKKVTLNSSFLPTVSLSPLHKNILKCCVAYFIGSLFTYSPFLSGFIADITGGDPGDRSPSPSGHMVATVAVYFNPAKTVGGMLDADKYCLMGLLYASFISLGSMSMYWFFEVRAGWEWLADVLVILWIGLGMSGMAYMKMWMGKPTFNTACSMTSIILFVVVVKEGGWETLVEVSIIVLFGALVSNLVCCILWPQRGTRNLHVTMSQTLDSFSTLLTMITNTFLLEEPLQLVSQEKLDKATKDHQASFTKLKKDLSEAQSERLVGGPGKPIIASSNTGGVHEEDLGRAYENAVASLNRLGQHLNGLRSGISVQYELVKASRYGKLHLRSQSKHFRRSTNVSTHDLMPAPEDAEENALLQEAADAFGDLVEDLGPPLKALSATCSKSLKQLREVFNKPGQITAINTEEFVDLSETLERALFTFESTSNHAVLRLYRRGLGSPSISRLSESLQSSVSDNSVLMGAESENIFLVYFFFFTIQEFTKELISLVDAMTQICNIREANARSWKAFVTFPWKFLEIRLFSRTSDVGSQNKTGLRQRISTIFSLPPQYRRDTQLPKFPKVKPHAPNTKQTPSPAELSFRDRVGRTIWSIGAKLRENNSKFAIKAGMATAMLAAPAFFETTRPIFNEYRGEWALISFFVVISPTVGATNFMGLHRVLGTMLGAATAIATWTAFPENPYALSIFGFFFSIPCFYYIISRPDLAASSRFVLLTYNLTCLYCYNLRQVDISVVDIAFHRATAVIVGVVWAAIVSRFWWPIEARRELGKALGEFCLNIGWLYTRLVAFNSWENNSGPSIGNVEDTPIESTALLQSREHINESILEFMAMELHLQIKLIELQGLLAQTQHEPRLKGPFPIKLYRSMLTSLQTILDKLHSMRCVTSREEWYVQSPHTVNHFRWYYFHNTVRRDFILPTNMPRREMVGNVILYFSVLASAFRLKSPLPPYLPPAEKARQRLVTAIRQLDVVKNREIKGSRQLLFFAYALTMRGVIHELDYLGRTLQDTFGVIGESTDAFEALFADTVLDTV
ncbi:Fusaric acid resistance protein-like-domain-containing protein [Irpex rosettiformis]|uniref:Fusaric acid resistance protein-like-domain-containing protein n=1 Tax=Irpex rosettiformis TaxID=378272 RepID=A0ACB8U1R8_9APHY|nr:Fusaric acid resistance protein-like-domain-containing protein [Irpex rosettiformis]